jgi:hypothetical protein
MRHSAPYTFPKGIFALLIAFFISGCATTAEKTTAETIHPAGKALEFPQFSVQLPSASGWFEKSNSATEKFATRLVGATHSITAVAVLISQDDPISHKVVRLSVFESKMLLDKVMDKVIQAIRDQRELPGASGQVRFNSFHSGDFDDADPFSICRSYDYTAEASFGPLDQQGRPMILIWRGRVCIHNDLNIVTNISYTESRLPDEAPFPQFEQEAETFLNGFWKRY